MVLLSQFSALASFIKLILLLILFVAILAASYYVTKWYGKSGFANRGTRNISVVEAYQISPGKLIYIVKIGEKYIAMAGTKEQMVFLAELKPEELSLAQESSAMQESSFSDIFTKMVKDKVKRKKE